MELEKIQNKIKNIVHLISTRKFDLAKESINLNLKDNPNKEINYTLNGLIEYNRGDNENSIIFYLKAIKFNPKYISAYVNLSNVYEKIENYKKAEEYLKIAIKLNSNSDALFNSIGYIFFKRNKFDEAIDNLLKAVKINNKNFRAYFNLGNVYAKIDNHNNAIKFFKETININEKVPEVYFHLAESQKKIEDYKNALINYKIAQKEKTTWLRKEKICAKILECYLILLLLVFYQFHLNKYFQHKLF